MIPKMLIQISRKHDTCRKHVLHLSSRLRSSHHTRQSLLEESAYNGNQNDKTIYIVNGENAYHCLTHV
jgi:hypothetical protein